MLQFITHKSNSHNYLDSAMLALDGGCKWIQLRMKHSPTDEVREVALKLKEECKKRDAILIIDDYVDIAIDVDADGVHLGKNDMSISQARLLMGEKYIIGGTANTLDDVIQLIKNKVDYIGLGPFRFTDTKENLSPILGIEGYVNIMKECTIKGYKTPIVAIGGITEVDIPNIIRCGVSGIAVSGSIINSPDPVNETKKIIDILYKCRDEK